MTADLRALAEAATGGDWVALSDGTIDGDIVWVRARTQGADGRPFTDVAVLTAPSVVHENATANAAYIAAANPTAVLALLDERDTLRVQIAKNEAQADAYESEIERERDALLAEVERLNTEPMKAFESHMADENARLRRERNEALAEVDALRAEAVEREATLAGWIEADRIHSGQLNLAEAAIKRVRALHRPIPGNHGVSECEWCQDPDYPCATIRALDVTP